MGSLPLKARLYLVIMYLAGLTSLATVFLCQFPKPHCPSWIMALLLTVALLTGSRKVTLMRFKGTEDSGSMSLGFAITFAAMLCFGPLGGVLVGIVSSLSGCLYPKRQPAHQLFFNLSVAAFESLISGLIFLIINVWSLTLDPIRTPTAVAASSLSYFALNTLSVAIIIGLCTNERIFPLWKETFLWTAPSYFAGATVSTFSLMMVGSHAGVFLLFTAPVVYFTYQSYVVWTARAEEKQRHLEENEKHIGELQQSQAHLASLYLATIKSLALAIDAKDQYTHQHILRVQRYSMAIANDLGLTGDELEGLNTGALLHDIGKLGVPEYILLKPGRLTPEEFDKIKKHPEIGADILAPVEFPWPVIPVVKYHHEKWDGSGYPEGLKGKDIPLTARILAVADVYDALTSARSYRHAWEHQKAVDVITQGAGIHFDPVIVDAFLRVIDAVVTEMATEGQHIQSENTPAATSTHKAAQAARHIQQASSELWALYEVVETLSASLGVQDTLDILASKLEAIFPGTACLFLLTDAEETLLLARTAVGLNHEFFRGSRTIGPASASLLAAKHHETYCGEFDNEDLLLTGAVAGWEPLRSALIVPIAYQGKTLGTVNLYHPEPDAFSSHGRQLTETIADRAAMAIYNGLLFDRTRRHAWTDPLTGLYNLRYLTQQVEEKCRQRTDSHTFALLCLDMDSFKPINDNFGHQKGDQVLCDLGKIFRSLVQAEDIVARYGGDEFLIVLDNGGQTEAEEMARQVRRAVASYDPGLYHARLGTLRLGVSIGYGCFPADGHDCATLLSAADHRMYQKKAERKLGTLAENPLLEAPMPESAPLHLPSFAGHADEASSPDILSTAIGNPHNSSHFP